MNDKWHLLTSLSIFLLLFAACQQDPTEESPEATATVTQHQPITLEGRDWVLVELNGESIVWEGEEQAPYIRIQTDSASKVIGFAGCNRFFGGCVVSGDSLTFDAIGSTRRMCDGQPMDIEDALLPALHRVAVYALDDKGLSFSGEGNVVMRFESN